MERSSAIIIKGLNREDFIFTAIVESYNQD